MTDTEDVEISVKDGLLHPHPPTHTSLKQGDQWPELGWLEPLTLLTPSFGPGSETWPQLLWVFHT